MKLYLRKALKQDVGFCNNIIVNEKVKAYT